MGKVLGLIPARGGSRGIPRKNLAPLAGKPLLGWTCEAALESRLLDRVILSTDDEEIARTARELGVEVPFLRPEELARDTTPSLPVARHALTWLEREEGWNADVLVLLQPTSPLRRAHHVDEALERMTSEDADTVVSVMRVPHQFSPFSLMEPRDGLLESFWTEPVPFDRYRRQEHPVLYARNGPAVLACRTSVILRHESFYGSRVVGYEMDEGESLDIDTEFDLQVAEWLLGGGAR